MGEMTEHALQPHVLRLARCLYLAGVVVVADTCRRLRDRDERVQPFADVDDFCQVHPRRSIAAVHNEQARNRWHVTRQKARGARREHERHGHTPANALLPRFTGRGGREQHQTGQARRRTIRAC